MSNNPNEMINELMIEEGGSAHKNAPVTDRQGRLFEMRNNGNEVRIIPESTGEVREFKHLTSANLGRGTYTAGEGYRDESYSKGINVNSGLGAIDGQILSTAKNQAGRQINSSTELTDDSMVTVGNTEARLGNLVKQGIIQKNADGYIDPSVEARWQRPEAKARGQVPVMSLIDSETQGALNALENIVGQGAYNAAMATLVGAAIADGRGGGDPQEHGKAARRATQVSEELAKEARLRTGKPFTAGNVADLVQGAMESATGGVMALCEHEGVGFEPFMDYLDSCSQGYVRSFYLSVLGGTGRQALKHVAEQIRLRNRH